MTRINTLSNATDSEQICASINALKDAEERDSCKEAFFRATLKKVIDGHPNAVSMASYALKVR